MANRRMFSLDIVDSDAFLDMPESSQNLYFHLGMRADDDGFVSSPKKILRVLNSREDDLKLLVAKRFILSFPSGICVIKHWKMNNYIQADRYKPTVYKEEFKSLKVKENGSYTELNPLCIQSVSKVETQVRLGKVSTVSESNDSHIKSNKKETMAWQPKTGDDFEEGFVDYDDDHSLKEEKQKPTRKYPNAPAVRKIFQEVLGRNPLDWNKNKNQLTACENLVAEHTLEEIKQALQKYLTVKDQPYCPQISSPHDLDGKWDKLQLVKVQEKVASQVEASADIRL